MRKSLILIVGCVVVSSMLYGQDEDGKKVSIGVKAGVPITDAFETFQGNDAHYFTNTKRYLIGPTIEFHLPYRLSIEVDGLYKRVGYEYQQLPEGVAARTVANSWEIPGLLKWEILPGGFRPFVLTGASLRHITGINELREVAGTVVELENAPEFNKRNDVGFVFGGGVAFKMGPVRISPEFRYVRWGSEAFRDPVNSLLRTNRNQGDFLLGFTF